jgi:rhodanese-related sulfurtransferase
VDFARIIEFTGNHLILVLAFAGTLGALVYTEISRRLGGLRSVGPMEATQLSNRENAVFVDVREEGEYRGGHIPEAVHIPLKQLAERAGELNRFKGVPVIAYCRTGTRTGRIGAILKKHGIENVYNLSGGITAWQSANLPTTTK